METPASVPSYLRSTYVLIKQAYPEGIPEDDYFPLLAILSEEGMSNRNVAAAIGCYKDRSYVDFLHDVGHVLPNMQIRPADLARVEDRLRLFGLEDWREEDD